MFPLKLGRTVTVGNNRAKERTNDENGWFSTLWLKSIHGLTCPNIEVKFA